MSRISDAFAGGKAFIPFFTCGDPDLDTTGRLVRTAVEAGADLIELGIPFSDPTAEGPVIQAANVRALAGGVTTDRIFDFVRELRKDVTVPIVFMTYANVVYSYGMTSSARMRGSGAEQNGIAAFAARCAEAGADGLILPDVPFEEKEEFRAVFGQYGLPLISMIAPTSENRIAEISEEAEGFLYVVSSLGVTGVRSEITTDIGGMLRLVRQHTGIPCAVGFGISTPEQASEMAALSDGAIVGSAIMRLVGEYGRESVEPVRALVRGMAAAVHGV